MANERMCITIQTCEKFSDIWDAQVKLMNKYWADRNYQTFLITDEPTERDFENIKIISTDYNLNLPERSQIALSQIDSEYILLTLDDYFLVSFVDNNCIEEILNLMDQHQLDYLSLSNRKGMKKTLKSELNKKYNIHQLDIFTGEDYILNLYPAIWRKSFFEKTFVSNCNIWEYEVSLTKVAIRENANCAVSNTIHFNILDGIRKGKFLNKSYDFLLRNRLYTGDREVLSQWIEIKLFIFDFIRRNFPNRLVHFLKKIGRFFGMKFYS